MTPEAQRKGRGERESPNERKRHSTGERDHHPLERGRDYSGPTAGKYPLSRVQRARGNREVQRLVKEWVEAGARPRLAVGRTNDEYEREADRISERAVRAPDSDLQHRSDGDGGEFPGSDHRIQRRGTAGRTDGEAPPIVREVLRSSGRPLRPGARSVMETRLGHDFGHVRVHTDARADESARAVNALAYTAGQHIAFRSGAYRPETASGKRLLAHELVHVRQQDSVAVGRSVQRFEGPEHQDFAGRYLDELLPYLGTEEGAQWARKLGFDPDDLVARITADPMYRGEKISLGTRRVRGKDGEYVLKTKGELTPGEIISLMGDHYPTAVAIANAPVREKRAVLDVIQEERIGRVPNAGERFERITGNYMRLAERNDIHFAGLNRAEWRRLHEEALAEARGAGYQQSEERFQYALLLDAAAGHFLTDAFASGHLFNKAEVLAAIGVHLATHPARTRNPYMQAFEDIVGAKDGALEQLVVKNVHDRMNREGFEVSNARGMRWRTYGDDHLEASEETQRIAALAVFLSRQQVFAARDGADPNPDEIEELMPDDDTVERATQRAITYVPDAVAEVEGLLYRERSMSPVTPALKLWKLNIGYLVEPLLTTAGRPGLERDILGARESARLRGAERDPFFLSPTIVEWDWPLAGRPPDHGSVLDDTE